MTVGNLDRRDLKASLDLPFTESFRSRFTVAQYDRDGYITSLTTAKRAARSKMRPSRPTSFGSRRTA